MGSLGTLPQMGHHPMQDSFQGNESSNSAFKVPALPSHMQVPELPGHLVCPSPLPSLPPIRPPGTLPPLDSVPHYSPPQSARLNAELAEKARQKAASEDAECQQVVEEEAARKFAQDEAARQKATPPTTPDTAAMLVAADTAAMVPMEMDLDSDNECNEIDADLSAIEEEGPTAAEHAEEDAAYAAWLLDQPISSSKLPPISNSSHQIPCPVQIIQELESAQHRQQVVTHEAREKQRIVVQDRIMSRSKDEFNRYDENGDGVLDRDEMALRSAAKKKVVSDSDLCERDSNGDGLLDQAEFIAGLVPIPVHEQPVKRMELGLAGRNLTPRKEGEVQSILKGAKDAEDKIEKQLKQEKEKLEQRKTAKLKNRKGR